MTIIASALLLAKMVVVVAGGQGDVMCWKYDFDISLWKRW
jgi:hypothetical protein